MSLSFQEIILKLHAYWARQGCLIVFPYDTEKGVDGLPGEARDHLKKMKIDSIETMLPPAAKKKGKPQESKPKKETDGEVL